jgi:hypothetical protein
VVILQWKIVCLERTEFFRAHQSEADGTTTFQISNELRARGEMRQRPSVHHPLLSVILHVFGWTVFLESGT